MGHAGEMIEDSVAASIGTCFSGLNWSVQALITSVQAYLDDPKLS